MKIDPCLIPMALGAVIGFGLIGFGFYEWAVTGQPILSMQYDAIGVWVAFPFWLVSIIWIAFRP